MMLTASSHGQYPLAVITSSRLPLPIVAGLTAKEDHDGRGRNESDSAFGSSYITTFISGSRVLTIPPGPSAQTALTLAVSEQSRDCSL